MPVSKYFIVPHCPPGGHWYFLLQERKEGNLTFLVSLVESRQERKGLGMVDGWAADNV